MADCLDLRIGGTLSATGIAGGQTIQVPAHGPASLTGLLGHPGYQNQGVRRIGRPGLYIPDQNLALERRATLAMIVTGQPLPGETISDDGACWELDANTDRLLGYLNDPAGVYLERDLADGSSRFLKVRALDSFPIAIPALFTRTFTAVLVADYPWWQAGGTQTTVVVSGNTTINNPGTAPIQAIIASFAADGEIHNATAGVGFEIAGATATVTVDTLNGTIIQSGVDADALLADSDADELFRLDPGDNTITHSGGNITLTFRTAYE